MERLPVTWAAGLPLPRLWPQGPRGAGQNPRVLSQPPTPAGVCRYKDYREPPWSEHKYDISKDFWAVLAARLAFVIVFQVRGAPRPGVGESVSGRVRAAGFRAAELRACPRRHRLEFHPFVGCFHVINRCKALTLVLFGDA